MVMLSVLSDAVKKKKTENSWDFRSQQLNFCHLLPYNSSVNSVSQLRTIVWPMKMLHPVDDLSIRNKSNIFETTTPIPKCPRQEERSKMWNVNCASWPKNEVTLAQYRNKQAFRSRVIGNAGGSILRERAVIVDSCRQCCIVSNVDVEVAEPHASCEMRCHLWHLRHRLFTSENVLWDTGDNTNKTIDQISYTCVINIY